MVTWLRENFHPAIHETTQEKDLTEEEFKKKFPDEEIVESTEDTKKSELEIQENEEAIEALTDFVKTTDKAGLKTLSSFAKNPTNMIQGQLMGILGKAGVHGALAAAIIAVIISTPEIIRAIVKVLSVKGGPLNQDFHRFFEDENQLGFSRELQYRRAVGLDVVITNDNRGFLLTDPGFVSNSLVDVDPTRAIRTSTKATEYGYVNSMWWDMSEEFATFQLWIAKSLASPLFSGADADKKFENDSQIVLDYCIPKQFSKKRTDVTGVQSDQNVHPDTGPAAALVEVQFTVNRGSVLVQDFLSVLIKMYGIQNTDSDFRRGFIGMDNSDNPQLSIPSPSATLGYKMVQFEQIDAIDFKSRQIYRVLLQLQGKAIDLPNLSWF